MAARRDPSQSGTLNVHEYASRADQLSSRLATARGSRSTRTAGRRLAFGPFSPGSRLGGRRRRGLHREEAGGGAGEELARLQVFECAFDVHVLRRLLDGAAPTQDRALEWREPEVAHGQLAGDMRPARVGESRSR